MTAYRLCSASIGGLALALIVGGEHVAFHFKYSIEKYGKVEPFEIPTEAGKILAKSR